MAKKFPGQRLEEGVWPDLKTMTAHVSIYRGNDPACCPSGGMATVKLNVNKLRLQIDGVTLSNSAPVSPLASGGIDEAHEPVAGSAERKEILDAVRPLVEKPLQQPVIFVVLALPVANDWAVALLQPQTKDGKSIDWRKKSPTEKKQQPELVEDGLVLALLKKEIGRWNVWEFMRGDIFQGLSQWPAKYPGVPENLFGLAGVATNCDPC